MLLRCDNCGAPFDVDGNARRARCHYCGQTKRVERLERVADETPEGWQPPKEWNPPAHSPLAGRSLVYQPVRAIGRALSLAIRLGIFVVVGTVVWRVVGVVNRATNSLSSATGASQLQATVQQLVGAVTNTVEKPADGPVSCGGSDVVTLTGRTLSVEGPVGVPVTASGNCRVRLVDCRLSGATAVVARGNARVSVEGGTLTGVKIAVALSDNAVLDISGGTLVTGAPAIAAFGNSRTTLREASINGAVETRENGSVDAVGAKLLGPITGTHRVRK